MKPKIALILCGSGYKDGSEIRESVAALWALSKHQFEVDCFALQAPQKDVINCLTGEPQAQETRNQLVEAARIARGKIKPLTELHAHSYTGLVIPGGFGAAKNLCTYAFEGIQGSVQPIIQERLMEFYDAKKPIVAICIAPMVVAMAFRHKNFELSEGAEGDVANDIQALGHKHIVLKAHQAHVDLKNKIITSPAYMYDDAPLHEIFDGIENAILKLKELI